MASQHQSYITLDSCINDYLDESEQSIHKYYKCFNLAFRCMDELGLDYFYQIKSVKLPINANKTVTIPADFLQYTKIGVLNNCGEIIPLYHNNNFTTYADLLPNRVADTQDNGGTGSCGCNPNYNVFNNYWGDGTYQTLYGLPSGSPFVGSFKVDPNNGVILLNENFCYDYLMVEYVASPVQGETYYVPIQFREAVISYLRWKDIISVPAKTHVQNSNVGMRRKEYYNERRLAKARWTPFYTQEAHQLNMEQTRLTVKI